MGFMNVFENGILTISFHKTLLLRSILVDIRLDANSCHMVGRIWLGADALRPHYSCFRETWR
jgi:hypothetical protein